MNIRLDIEYDGGQFSGYAVQPNKKTVQGVLEKKLATIYQHKIKVVGAGRTDTGVHARGQVVHFNLDEKVDLKLLHGKLNKMIGRGLAITAIREVSDKFHARFSAKCRVYTYQLSTRKLGPLAPYYTYIPYPLNMVLFRSNAKKFLGNHAFHNFSIDEGERGFDCIIASIKTRVRHHHIIIELQANRFLRRMVRMITGSLVDVARGHWDENRINELLENPVGLQKPTALGPEGLFLERVEY